MPTPPNQHDTGNEVDQAKEALAQLASMPEWDRSMLLKTSKKKLLQLLDSLDQHTEQQPPKTTSPPPAFSDNTVLVFVSLFQSDGRQISRWENALRSLTQGALGRPIYQNEQHVIDLIRSKPQPLNEAYVAVHIAAESLIDLPPERTFYDANNHPLCSLRPKSLHPDRIAYVVHAGTTYFWQNNHLVPKA